MLCPECIFVDVLHYQMVQIRKFFGYYQYFWLFLVKMWAFDPPGSLHMGLPLTVMQFILNRYHHQTCQTSV